MLSRGMYNPELSKALNRKVGLVTIRTIMESHQWTFSDVGSGLLELAAEELARATAMYEEAKAQIDAALKPTGEQG